MSKDNVQKQKILFAVSEAVPLIKTGGLADVAGSLPKAMEGDQFDCRVMLPYYRKIRLEWQDKVQYLGNFRVPLAGEWKYAGLFSILLDGISYYLIDNEEYFDTEKPYEDGLRDIGKFIFFDRAVLGAVRFLDWKPQVIHCHDWQTALLPALLKAASLSDPFFAGIHTVFTIHNLRFQGVWNMEDVKRLSGLPQEFFSMDGLEYYGNANLLKGGIIWSEAVTTVSETYAEEILTPEYGEGLDGLLRNQSFKLSGILNGIDTVQYDPKTDEYVRQNYSVRNVVSKKRENKLILQKELRLREDPDAFMAVMVSRLTDQKGVDLIVNSLEQLCSKGVQMVFVGTGQPEYEQSFRDAASRHPDSVAAVIRFSEKKARRVYAGGDIYLMPSRFEPCGLSQLIALRYGTLPVVRETGGLKDTVIPYNRYTGEGNGFSFAGYSAEEFIDCVERARYTYEQEQKNWRQLIRQAMKEDFSWAASAKKYQELYRKLIDREVKQN